MAGGEAHRLKRTTTISAALLAVHLALVGWVYASQARAWPHVGAWADVVLYLAAPGIFFHAVRLVWLWRAKRAPRAWAVRLFTIPAGLVLAALLAGTATRMATRGFVSAYTPFVTAVDGHLADPCGHAQEYFSLPSVAAYNARTGRDQPRGTLSHGGGRFVLAFGAGSLDIDGSTIYYDSKDPQWRLFHNDSKAATAAYDQLRAGLAECELRAGP